MKAAPDKDRGWKDWGRGRRGPVAGVVLDEDRAGAG